MLGGVLYTAERLAFFGYALSTPCFCSDPMESLQHLFFNCPLVISVLSWLQSVYHVFGSSLSYYLASSRLFGSADELSAVTRVFVCLLNVSLMFASFAFGAPVMIFVFGTFVPRLLMLWNL